MVALETALRAAQAFNGPVIVHAITEKGRGYAPAEADEADRFHGVGQINPDTGVPLAAAGETWTGVFTSQLLGWRGSVRTSSPSLPRCRDRPG